jgi:hypothetical protein
LENENEWLYSEGQNSNRGIYNDHISNVKSKVNAIAKRYDSFELLVYEVNNLNSALVANTTSLNSLVIAILFRIKNTNISLPKNDNKDSATLRKSKAGLQVLTKSKEISPNGKTLS